MTELTTLVRGMTAGNWKKLTAASQGSFNSAMLARTRANFDASTTWADDASVGATPPSGIGGAAFSNVFSFSAPAVSDDGLVVVFGGGHTNGGDSSGFYFDIEAAAASINASSVGGTWGLAWKGAKILDAFTDSKPAWSFESAGTTPTAVHQAFWADDNADGDHMFPALHTYWMPQFLPGTRTLLISGANKFDTNGFSGSGPGACFVIDLTTPSAAALTGPFQPASYPSNAGGGAGYHVNTHRSAYYGLAPMPNDLDGTVLSYGSSAYNGLLFKWTNPSNPTTVSLARVGTFAGNLEPNSFQDLLLFPDPVNGSTKRAIFQNKRTNNSTRFLLIKDAAGTPAEVAGTYASSVATRQTNVGYSWDSSRSKIVVSDGVDLYHVTVSSDTAAWSIAKITGSAAGDVPATTTGTSFPRVKYLANEDVYVLADYGDVWVYKPTDWVDPDAPAVTFNPAWAANSTITISSGARAA